MSEKPPRSAAALTISWAAVAGASMVIAVAAVTGLAIVAAVKKVDTLSAVALSLAIVAFMTQIVVFIAQTWSTSQLNAETRGFLEELRTRSQGSEEFLGKQVDKLTDDLMSRAAVLAKGGQPPSEARELVRRDVVRALSQTNASEGPDESLNSWIQNPYNAGRRSAKERDEVLQKLATFPPVEEGTKLAEDLRSLSPEATAEMRRYGIDLKGVTESRSGIPGFPDTAESRPIKELLDKGLLEDISTRPDWVSPLMFASNWFALTDPGVELARLLIAPGEAPDYVTAAKVKEE